MSPPPLERFPAASRYVASPNAAILRGRTLQPPDPPPAAVAAETAVAEAGRRAEPQPRPTEVLRFSPSATLTDLILSAPGRVGRGTLWRRTGTGSRFPSGRSVGEERAEVERRVDVAVCRGTAIRIQRVRRSTRLR